MTEIYVPYGVVLDDAKAWAEEYCSSVTWKRRTATLTETDAVAMQMMFGDAKIERLIIYLDYDKASKDVRTYGESYTGFVPEISVSCSESKVTDALYYIAKHCFGEKRYDIYNTFFNMVVFKSQDAFDLVVDRLEGILDKKSKWSQYGIEGITNVDMVYINRLVAIVDELRRNPESEIYRDD